MLQGDVTYQGDTSQERKQEIRIKLIGIAINATLKWKAAGNSN